MPSGAKKRKAAKKKMENQSDNQSEFAPAHPHGGDDRESDVSEVSSPMSQDHQKLPVEGEGDEIESDGGVIDPLSAVVEEGASRDGKEIKIEDEFGKKDEANKATYGDGESSSSSSSSDDESRGIKKVESVELADSLSRKLVEPVCDSLTADVVVLNRFDLPSNFTQTIEKENTKQSVNDENENRAITPNLTWFDQCDLRPRRVKNRCIEL